MKILFGFFLFSLPCLFFCFLFSLWLFMTDVFFSNSCFQSMIQSRKAGLAHTLATRTSLKDEELVSGQIDTNAHRSSDSFLFLCTGKHTHTHTQILICIHRQTHPFTLFSPTVLLLSLCCSHSVKANIL